MKRFMALILLIVMLLPLCPVSAEGSTQTDIAISVGTDETERSFVWYSPSSEPGTLRLWIDWEPMEYHGSYSSTVTKASDGDYFIHRVTLRNLLPEIDFVYQLINEGVESPLYRFSTPSLGDFSFIFAGDPQLGESKDPTKDRAGWALALDRIINHEVFRDAAFLLSAGDHVDEKNNESHFDDLLHHDALTGIPMANVIGNHEAKSEIFSQHFFRPNESTEYGVTPAGGDCYFLFNDVLFFLINSNNKNTEEHRAFMESVLAEHPDPLWKVVALHHSLYTVASHAYDESILERREELVPLFHELDIDVVLSGHDHVYCRSYIMDGLEPLSSPDMYDQRSISSVTNPDGVLYITANSSSGSKTYKPKEDVFPYSAAQHQFNVGELSRVSVTENSFTIKTYRTDTMEEVDSFTIFRKDEAPHPFTDVSPEQWYNRAVQHAYTHGIMNGVEDTLFSPNTPTTRGMFVTILHRLDGGVSAKNVGFDDVPSTAYYAQAVNWAAENGIVTGVSTSRFAPEQEISREQLVTMIARYAAYLGRTIPVEDQTADYTDASLISPYALAPMNWALQEGLLVGTSNNKLSPQGTATRAQIAQIMMRLQKMLAE